MTDEGYAITLYDPMARPVSYAEVPASFTVEYFVGKFQKKWQQGAIRYPSDYLMWFIPELDSADPDNKFSGLMGYQDKGISFHLVPHATVVEFVRWIRSIVPNENIVYLIKIPDLIEILEITQTTEDEEIFGFLEHRSLDP